MLIIDAVTVELYNYIVFGFQSLMELMKFGNIQAKKYNYCVLISLKWFMYQLILIT